MKFFSADRFLKAYESMGINFWGLTFANKPFSSSLPNGPEGVPMSPLDEKDFLKHDLGPLLKQAGYGKDRLKVFIMNDIISTAPYWSTIITSDDEAASYVSGLAFTWYLKHHIKSSQYILNFLHERWPDYYLLSSEAMVGINSKGEQSEKNIWCIHADFHVQERSFFQGLFPKNLEF